MIYLLENVDLTIGYILKLTKDLDDNTPVYNSCFYSKYTQELLEMGRIKEFQAIYSLIADQYNYDAEYNFEGKNNPIFLKELRQIEENRLHLHIERDIADGYTYDEYENIVYYEGAIVLC